METILCKNPICKASIEYVPGMPFAFCSACGEWTDLEPSLQKDEELQGSFMNFGSEDQYNTPPYNSDLQFKSDLPPEDDKNLIQEPVIAINYANNLATESDEQTQVKTQTPNGRLTFLDGKVIPLQIGRTTLGRLGTDILLDDNSVSRRHCIIDVEKDPLKPGSFLYFIADSGFETGRGSSNGVFLSQRSLRLENNERLKLLNHTVITLGSTKILFTFEH